MTLTKSLQAGTILAALFFLSSNAVDAVKLNYRRPTELILNYTIHGLSLNTPVGQAKNILKKQGFTLIGEDDPKRKTWRYMKDKTIVVFDMRYTGNGLRNIEVTEKPDDGRFDLASQVEKVNKSWQQTADGKPVCLTQEIKGKIVMAECGVVDEKEKAAYSASMSTIRMQFRLHIL